MAEPSDHPPPSGSIDRAFRGAVGREATAFGFSIVVSAAFGLLQLEHGSPSRWEIVLFAIGAGVSFVGLTGVASRGFRRPLPQHSTEVVGLAAGLNLISVMIGVGTAMGSAALLGSGAAWPLCPLLATTAYLLVESVEELVSERWMAGRGEGEPESVSG